MLTSGNVKGFYPIISYKIKSSFMSFLYHNDNSTTIIKKSSVELHFAFYHGLYLLSCFVNFQFLSIVQSLTICLTSGSFLTNLGSCIRTQLYTLNILHKNHLVGQKIIVLFSVEVKFHAVHIHTLIVTTLCYN